MGGFLGKANIFKAQAASIEGRPALRIAQAVMPLDGVQLPEGSVLIRPEKILFAAASTETIPGVMKSRVFQGNHWLCQIQTSVGEVLVIRQNDGVQVPPEGSEVHITWRAADMRAVRSSEKVA